MTIAGAMLMETREVLAGKDPRKLWSDKPFENFKFWFGAMVAGGGMGIYGDFLEQAIDGRLDRLLTGGLGPTIGPLLEMGLVDPLHQASRAMQGKETNLLVQEAKQLKTFAPFGNVWYAKAALDHLIFNQVFELLSPGYLASIRSRTMRQNSQDWWWKPGELTPDRAPDLGAALDK